MDSYTIIVLIFGVLILGILILLFFINRLTLLKRYIENQYQIIYNHLKIRADLIKEMIPFIEKNLEHEENFIKKLKKAINTIENSETLTSDLTEVKKTKEIVSKFLELENTYTFLTKNKEYNELKEKFTTNEDRLIYSSESYDKGVVNYNNYLENKFIHFLGKVFRFPTYNYYNKQL